MQYVQSPLLQVHSFGLLFRFLFLKYPSCYFDCIFSIKKNICLQLVSYLSNLYAHFQVPKTSLFTHQITLFCFLIHFCHPYNDGFVQNSNTSILNCTFNLFSKNASPFVHCLESSIMQGKFAISVFKSRCTSSAYDSKASIGAVILKSPIHILNEFVGAHRS